MPLDPALRRRIEAWPRRAESTLVGVQQQPAAISDELVAAAADDPSARDRVLEAMTPQVRIMINARLHPTPAQAHLADDLVQESLLSLREGMQRLERRTAAGLRAFASTIVSRRVADALRERRAGRRAGFGRSLDSTMHADMSACAPLWAFLSASGVSPLSAADHADAFQRVMSALDGLTAEQREAITLAFFDQLDTRDIARHMSISRPAASMLLIRAVKSLRRSLTGSSRIASTRLDDDAD